MSINDEEIQDLYVWVDQVPLSRPKRNIARDYADAVLAAETIQYFYPKLVEMHNYSAANAYSQKIYNWQTLNKKVLKRLGINLSQQEMEALCNCQAMAVESLLLKLKHRIEEDKARLHGNARSCSPGSGGEGSKPGGELSSSRGPSSRGIRQETPGAMVREPRAASRGIASAAGGADAAWRQHGGGGGGAVGGGGGASGARRGLSGQYVDDGGYNPVTHLSEAEKGALQREVDTEMLVEKEQTIQELRETVDILEAKVKKLEQLVRLKDAKIDALTARLSAAPR